MTELLKPITRRTTLLLDNRSQIRRRDRFAVTLYPDNTIGFRQHRSRKEVRLHLTTVYRIAFVEKGKQEAEEKKKRRLIKKGLV